jgi:hypothetical protein
LAQIFIATHSEYVVKSALSKENTTIVIMDNEEQTKYVISQGEEEPPSGFLLRFITSAEIIFKIFSIYSIEYHQFLFERLISLYEIKRYSDIDNKKNDYNNEYKKIFSTKEEREEMKVPDD